MENETVCTNDQTWEKLLFLPLPIVSFCINLLLFFSTTINRKKLERQNYIYICVISILLSNVLFIVIHTWVSLDNYFSNHYKHGKSEKTLWTFFQTALVSIQFVLCGNIGSLLFVVLDSTYFVGRSVNRKASEFVKELRSDIDGLEKHPWIAIAKRRKAFFLIALAWLLPVVFTIVATVVWNCKDECVFCAGGTPFADVCGAGNRCSHIWPPVSDDYLIVHVVLWFLEDLGLLLVIYSGIKSFKEVMSPPKTTTTSQTETPNHVQDKSGEKEEDKTLEERVIPFVITTDLAEGGEVTSMKNTNGERVQNNSISEGSSYPTPTSSMCNTNCEVETEEQRNKSEKHQTHRRSVFKLHSRINFMIVVSSTFFLCTLPLVVSFILDISGAEIHYETASSISAVFIYIYTIACPLILLKYFPNLKTALLVLFRKCSCSRLPKVYRRKSTTRNQRNAANSST